MKLLGSALQRRLKHQHPRPFITDLEWSEKVVEVDVRGGPVASREVQYGRQDGSRCTVQVEVAHPHRRTGWHCSNGESARLLGTQRLPCWSTHKEGDEGLLRQLGLPIP